MRGYAGLEVTGGQSRDLAYGLRVVRSMAAGFYEEGDAATEFEELVSYGHLGLANALSSFNENRGSSFRNYAWKCIRNAILDGVKAEGDSSPAPLINPQHSFMTDASSEFSLHEAACILDPFLNQVKQQSDARLQSALIKLPGRERLVIELQYFEELSVREIGERLGISEGRTYQIRTTALDRLRRLLSRSAF